MIIASTSQVVAIPDVHSPSYTRLPFFNGTDYAYWRNKMEIFLDSEGVNIIPILLKKVRVLQQRKIMKAMR